MREKVNEVVSKVILIRAEAEDKWRTHCLTSSQERREGDKKRVKGCGRLICVSCKWRKRSRRHKPDRRENRMNGSERRTHSHPCLLSFFSSGLKETPLRSQTGPPACSMCLSYSGGKTGHKKFELISTDSRLISFGFATVLKQVHLVK